MITATVGAMSWITDGFELKTNTGGGVMKGLARAFAGEGMFLNHYIAIKDSQEVAFESSLSDSTIVKELNVETLIGQKLFIYYLQ